MNETLALFGKVAGIGGLALGVFLFLFKKINLPAATRRHLTLFMWLVWSIAVLGIIIYGISAQNSVQSSAEFGSKEVPKFEGSISVTTRSESFYNFLASHESELVALDSEIDMSLSTEEQQTLMEENGDDRLIDRFAENPNGVLLRLPTDDLVYLKFQLLNGRTLPQGSGGTGIVRFPIRGYFDVTRTIHAGSSFIFHLTEVSASISDLKKL